MKKQCFLVNRFGILVFGWVCFFPGQAVPQDRGPRTGWGDREVIESAKVAVAPDLQSLYDRSASATTVGDFNTIAEGCRTIAGDTTRLATERDYAKKLLSWAANRRGELRTDAAGQMVRDHYLEEAEELDLKAADDFALAIEYDPTRWRAHHNLGIARALVGEVDRAIASFTQALELNPKFADAFFNRAELLAKKQDFNASLADYDRAIELTPDDAGMRTARANLKSSLGDAQGALADFEEAMRLQPESGDAAAAFADACQSAARWKDAATAYQQALKLDPDNPRALQNAAWMMATCPDEYFRNPETALKTAQRAMEASEGPVTAHRLHVLGVAQAAAGDFDSAVASLHEAIQLTSDPILRREIAQHRAMFQRKQAFVQPNPSP